MKRKNTSDRLKQLMEEKNIRQVDVLKLTQPYCQKYDIKMNKSDISQYISGKVEPSQEKLVVLGMALGVNEAWLMGFDVERNRKETNSTSAVEDILILEKLSLLNERDKKIVVNMIDSFLKNGD